MGNVSISVQKGISELKYSLQTSQSTYTFNQRKGDRLIGLFFLSCLANIGIVALF